MRILSLFFILFAAMNVVAGNGIYNFEDAPSGGTSMFLNIPGVRTDVSRSNTNTILGQSNGSGFGNYSLSPFNAPTIATAYDVYFFNPVTKFSCEFGDADADTDTLTIRAYNAFDELIATATDTLTNSGGFTKKKLTVEHAGIHRVQIIGGSVSQPNSVFYDNFEVTTVPLRTTFIEPVIGFPDITVFRPNGALWYSWNSAVSQHFIYQYGISSDKLIPGDYDGDNTSDYAVYRSGLWYIKPAYANNFYTVSFGLADDIPLSVDFDNDGKNDIAVFRPSNGVWYWLNSSDGSFIARGFGQQNDIPVPNDYDGDGKTDICIFRPSNSTWYLLRSSNNNLLVQQFGLTDDIPVAADYDGDGLTDIAVYRPINGTWYLLQSRNGFLGLQFGIAEDIPVPNDYSNFISSSFRDGKVDIAVWRPSNGTWYILKSDFVYYFQWGSSGDKPLSLINY